MSCSSAIAITLDGVQALLFMARRVCNIANSVRSLYDCIRMHQGNALSLLKRMRGCDKIPTDEQLWGEVPRFWREQKYENRYGYVRDGSLLREQVKVAETTPAGPVSGKRVATDAPPISNVLTKTGYRAVAVIFKD